MARQRLKPAAAVLFLALVVHCPFALGAVGFQNLDVGVQAPSTTCSCCASDGMSEAERHAAEAQNEAETCGITNLVLHRPHGDFGGAHLEVVSPVPMPDLGPAASVHVPKHVARPAAEGAISGHPGEEEAEENPDFAAAREHALVAAKDDPRVDTKHVHPKGMAAWGVRVVKPVDAAKCAAVVPGDTFMFRLHHRQDPGSTAHLEASKGADYFSLHRDTLLPLYGALEAAGLADPSGEYDHEGDYTLAPAVLMTPDQEDEMHLTWESVEMSAKNKKHAPFKRFLHPEHPPPPPTPVEEPPPGMPDAGDNGELPPLPPMGAHGARISDTLSQYGLRRDGKAMRSRDPMGPPVTDLRRVGIFETLGAMAHKVRPVPSVLGVEGEDEPPADEAAARASLAAAAGGMHEDWDPATHHDPFHSAIDWVTNAFDDPTTFWNDALALMASTKNHGQAFHAPHADHDPTHAPSGGVLPVTVHRFPRLILHEVEEKDTAVCYERVKMGLPSADLSDTGLQNRFASFMLSRAGYADLLPTEVQVGLITRSADGRILNEDELADALEAEGVRLEKLALDGTAYKWRIEKARTTTVLLGVTGAGLANALYMAEGGVGIQLVPRALADAATAHDTGDLPPPPHQDPRNYAKLLSARGTYLEWREGHEEGKEDAPYDDGGHPGHVAWSSKWQQGYHGGRQLEARHMATPGSELMFSYTPDIFVDVKAVVKLVKHALTLGINGPLRAAAAKDAEL